jgi:hypothetical protein
MRCVSARAVFLAPGFCFVGRNLVPPPHFGFPLGLPEPHAGAGFVTHNATGALRVAERITAIARMAHYVIHSCNAI